MQLKICVVKRPWNNFHTTKINYTQLAIICNDEVARMRIRMDGH